MVRSAQKARIAAMSNSSSAICCPACRGRARSGYVDLLWVRTTTPLSGSMGSGQRDLCGALSGGVLVIGRWHGRHRTVKAGSKAMNLPRGAGRAAGDPALSVARLLISTRRCHR